MKVNCFHLMSYPHLPRDFTEKHRSVWVDIPSDLYDPVKGHLVYNDYLDQLEYAEAAGFDGLCVNEHHANAYGMMPSPNLMAAALARRTSKAAIVVLGNSIALYNPPIRVAEELAMLDVISGGRLIAGFPLGTSMDATFAYGQTPVTLREKYLEAHDLITQAWSRREPFIFNGKYTQLRYVNVWPRPLQKPRPPIWIPGGGSLETWDFCWDHDYCYCYFSFFGYKRGFEVMKGFWDAAARRNVDANPYRAGYLQLVAVANSDEEAERLYAPHADYFYNRCLHVFEGFFDSPGYRTLPSLRQGFKPSSSAGPSKATWKDYVSQGYIIAGSPKTVREQLEEVLRTMRVGHLMTLCHFGDLPSDIARYNMELFGREVIPHLSGMWDDYEDRWWPKPIVNRYASGEGRGIND
ncbi:LLM class flavin-dependent oxidoreductase [Reyranella sp.]|uniref:LLM class flavin-dependent oxidoreductase n=1 Tax=Reyranella sp. TaxID=1929291 RepID=UPI0027315F74|nr:LLM class flavin-dependent oxidoreductase [Reyranella sp.]MDP2374370.1 LLM class flavin-dependent oxidoreductase [Reyranella sp.]